MLARLQCAAKHFDLKYDDVLVNFLDEQALKDDSSTHPNHVDLPKKQLSRKDFLKFHHYIDRYADKETKTAFKKLPWIRQGIYYKNKTGHWRCQPCSSNNPIRIPKRLRKPQWIFKGRNARYHAFKDSYLQISLYMQHQHIKLLHKQMHPEDPHQLQHIYDAIAAEQKRLLMLAKPLNRFFQKHTLMILREQIEIRKQQCREILIVQCHILENTIHIQSRKISEENIIYANRLSQIINAIDKSEFPNIQKQYIMLSNKLKHLSDENQSYGVPIQYRISEEIGRYITNKQTSIPSLALAIDAFDAQLFQSKALENILKTIGILLEDNTVFPKTAEQTLLLICLQNIFSGEGRHSDRAFVMNLHKQSLCPTPARKKAMTNDPSIPSEHPLIKAIENKQFKPKDWLESDELLSILAQYLRYLLDPNTPNPQYFDKLTRLKNAVLSLPNSEKNTSIKRLCNAGISINNIINELPGSIISMTQGEICQMPLLNPLLIDILSAGLIGENSKQILIKLLTLLMTNENTHYIKLHESLKLALTAFKKILTNPCTQEDRNHIASYQRQLQTLTQSQQSTDNLYRFPYTNTGTTKTEGIKPPPQSTDLSIK